MSPLLAQLRAEVTMTLRRGETLLLTIGIPVVFLVFFSSVKVITVPTTSRVDFFAPGILALTVMSTAMVSLSIATGFERGYGVLKRLGSTPLGRSRLLLAKVGAIALVEILQFVVIGMVALVLGFDRASGGTLSPVEVAIETFGCVVLATAAFAGIGLTMAGRLKAEVNLATANGLYLVFLLLGGMVVPLANLPKPLASVARLLPPAALSDALHALLGHGHSPAPSTVVTLAAWSVLAPLAAAVLFRFE